MNNLKEYRNNQTKFLQQCIVIFFEILRFIKYKKASRNKTFSNHLSIKYAILMLIEGYILKNHPLIEAMALSAPIKYYTGLIISAKYDYCIGTMN